MRAILCCAGVTRAELLYISVITKYGLCCFRRRVVMGCKGSSVLG